MSVTQALFLALPTSGQAPPGADRFNTLVEWGLWLATLACMGAVITAGVKIAMAGSGRGGGGEHGMTLLMSLAGAIICGVSAAIVTTLQP